MAEGKMWTDFPHMSMLNISLFVCWNKRHEMKLHNRNVVFFSGFNININIALICVDHVWYWRVSWRNGLLLMTNSHLKTCFWFKRWNIGTVPLFSRTVGCRGVLEYRGRGLKTQRFLTFWWLFGRNPCRNIVSFHLSRVYDFHDFKARSWYVQEPDRLLMLKSKLNPQLPNTGP